MKTSPADQPTAPPSENGRPKRRRRRGGGGRGPGEPRNFTPDASLKTDDAEEADAEPDAVDAPLDAAPDAAVLVEEREQRTAPPSRTRSTPTSELDFEEFMARVDRHELESVSVKGTSYRGKDTENVTFSARGPALDEALGDRLLKAGIEIKVIPEGRDRDRDRDRGGDREPRERYRHVESDALDREPARAAAVRDDGQPADIDPDKLDADGIKILSRLHQFNHEAYFVGGCVRDLKLGKTPKDFDIATSAHPNEIRALFRNCRLIGRRFRLAHIYFKGGKIIEVSTFRAPPLEADPGEELSEDLLITRDNVFGTAEQDARRRDFNLNGLFYDIRKGRVIDYVGGLKDLEERTIRTIGNPEVRMAEDPVRILRAVRFAAKLDLDIDPHTYAAMEGAVEDLPRCAPARLLEEVFRLLRSGASRRCFELCHALGALHILLPPIADHLKKGGKAAEQELFNRLGILDRQMKDRSDDGIIIATMLAPLADATLAEGEGQENVGAVIDKLLEEMVQTARLPRRVADRARHILWAQGVLSGERKRRKSFSSFRKHPSFDEALLVFEIGVEATGRHQEALAKWKEGSAPPVVRLPHPPGTERTAGLEPNDGKRRRRRRGGRGRTKKSPGSPDTDSDGGEPGDPGGEPPAE